MTVSLLVPFRAERRNDVRIKHWRWIRQRWEHILPGVEIVEGTTDSVPFSKSQAVNDAYRKSSGDILITADADTWIEQEHILIALEQASAIPHAVVPWTNCYRMTRTDSSEICRSDPATFPVTQEMIERIDDDAPPSPASLAMVVVIQRRAFEAAGGMDPRFLGWGGEDTSFGLACWTLLGPTVLLLGNAWSLYHARPKKHNTTRGEQRIWRDDVGDINFDLWQRYYDAKEKPATMAAICSEHPLEGARQPIGQLLDSPYMIDTPMSLQTVREPVTVNDRITI